MKLFSTIAAIAMGAAAVNAAAAPEPLQKRCINNGDRCKADGSWGNCCSNYCLQYKNVSLFAIFLFRHSLNTDSTVSGRRGRVQVMLARRFDDARAHPMRVSVRMSTLFVAVARRALC